MKNVKVPFAKCATTRHLDFITVWIRAKDARYELFTCGSQLTVIEHGNYMTELKIECSLLCLFSDLIRKGNDQCPRQLNFYCALSCEIKDISL